MFSFFFYHIYESVKNTAYGFFFYRLGSLSDIHDRLKELGIRDDERRCASARSEV